MLKAKWVIFAPLMPSNTIAKLIGVFDLKRRCAERLVHDIKVLQERFESIQSHLFSNRSCGTSMSYTNRCALQFEHA